jgi:CTP synthase
MTKYIFITGGVVSSLGKGITTSSIGALLKICGYSKIRFIKLDPYLNIDPGTMNPFEHGEVYVTSDGHEADLDLGHYERFSEIETNKFSNITSGKLYLDLLNKERKGEYLGKTVQIVPHLTDDIKSFLKLDSDLYDFVLCEVGGTVGDIEANPMIEAIRQFRSERPNDTISVHVTLIPMIKAAGELKTKPTQHSVRQLMERGIIPDLLVCRTSHKLDQSIKDKIAQYSNLTPERIIEAIDMDSIYKIPLYYAEQNMMSIISKLAHLPAVDLNDIDDIAKRKDKWLNLLENINITQQQQKYITLGIVGKYIPYDDAYKSLVESIDHASWFLQKKVVISWINARQINKVELIEKVTNCNCIIVPGGFGHEGIENKIETIRLCRENNIPMLGICLGMQLMVIEAFKNLTKFNNCISTEWLSPEEKNDPDAHKKYTICVGFIEEWTTDDGIQESRKDNNNMGGTMRLGNFNTKIVKDINSIVSKIYQNDIVKTDEKNLMIIERHRHRYEVNNSLIGLLSSFGIIVTGYSQYGDLPEIIENVNNTFMVGCQFHPEFKSTPFNPRPLFCELLNVC